MQTFTYTKLINGATGVEDQPRLDFINTAPLAAGRRAPHSGRAANAAAAFDVDPRLRPGRNQPGRRGDAGGAGTARRTGAQLPGEGLCWRIRARASTLFRNVIVKPNQQEAEAACLRLFGRVDYAALREHIGAPFAGGDARQRRRAGGGAGRRDVGARRAPWRTRWTSAARATASPPGAALALAATRSPAEAARFGNLVASITIMKKGTGTARRRKCWRPPELRYEHPGHRHRRHQVHAWRPSRTAA